jgi:hypothetical protein
MPRVNERRVVHKSTGGIPPKIPTPVGSVGNAHNHLTPNTVALSASQSANFCVLCEKIENTAHVRAFSSIEGLGEARMGCIGRHRIRRRSTAIWKFRLKLKVHCAGLC